MGASMVLKQRNAKDLVIFPLITCSPRTCSKQQCNIELPFLSQCGLITAETLNLSAHFRRHKTDTTANFPWEVASAAGGETGALSVLSNS